MRLNKYIASCGAASRRGADKLIEQGKVTVNGDVVISMGLNVDENNDIVCLDGAQLVLEDDKVYILLNKPAGFLCACSDDRGRKTVIDLVKTPGKRIFPVGRLDYDTEGLLLLTNDGDFAYRLTHPKHEVSKKYFAIVKGVLTQKVIERLCAGVNIDGVKTSKAEMEILNKTSKRTELNITIHEGRNRQIKNMFELVGCRVSYLKRIAVGRLEIGELPIGKWRMLSKEDKKLLDLNC